MNQILYLKYFLLYSLNQYHLDLECYLKRDIIVFPLLDFQFENKNLYETGRLIDCFQILLDKGYYHQLYKDLIFFLLYPVLLKHLFWKKYQ